MNSYWNERYREEEYAYGTSPNSFYAEQLLKLPVGEIVLPCEGEGRNAVFAAKNGWVTKAFDSSEEGLKKAKLLAKQNEVSISYEIADVIIIDFPKESTDVVALIYSHFPPEYRKNIHQKVIKWLKPGGQLILEAFNPKQLNNLSGGPKDESMLYTLEMLQDDFTDLSTQLLHFKTITLDEGKYHQGIADVVRYVGIKK